MTRRPSALLAMSPRLPERLWDADGWARLRELVDIDPALVWSSGPPPEVDAEVLLTFWSAPRVGPSELAALSGLRAVLHAGGTVRAILDEEVWRRGILVTTSADANAEPVARFALALVLLASRDALAVARRYARGEWSPGDTAAFGYLDSTVGIIGASRTGRALAGHLAPLGYRMLFADPLLDDAGAAALGGRRVELDELLSASDIVSLHAPDLPQTKGMLGAREFARMRDGTTFITTARPALIDQDALVAEVRSGRLLAMLDVTHPEPLPAGHPLFGLDGAFVTPHLAGAQGSELRLLGASVLDEVERFVRGEPPAHPLTLDRLASTA